MIGRAIDQVGRVVLSPLLVVGASVIDVARAPFRMAPAQDIDELSEEAKLFAVMCNEAYNAPEVWDCPSEHGLRLVMRDGKDFLCDNCGDAIDCSHRCKHCNYDLCSNCKGAAAKRTHRVAHLTVQDSMFSGTFSKDDRFDKADHVAYVGATPTSPVILCFRGATRPRDVMADLTAIVNTSLQKMAWSPEGQRSIRVARSLAASFPDRPVYACGHSLGGMRVACAVLGCSSIVGGHVFNPGAGPITEAEELHADSKDALQKLTAHRILGDALSCGFPAVSMITYAPRKRASMVRVLAKKSKKGSYGRHTLTHFLP